MKETAATAIHDAVYRGERCLDFFRQHNIRVLSICLIEVLAVVRIIP